MNVTTLFFGIKVSEVENERDNRDSLITFTLSHINKTEKAVELCERELWLTAIIEEAWQKEVSKKHAYIY